MDNNEREEEKGGREGEGLNDREPKRNDRVKMAPRTASMK